jgi:hypothetical protein
MPETHREPWMTERAASGHSALQTKWLESRRPRFAPQVTAQQFIALVAITAAATLAAPPTWHAPNDSWVQAFVVLTIVSPFAWPQRSGPQWATTFSAPFW